MRLLRVVGSLDPAEGGLSQAIRSASADLEKLGVSTEVVSCDSPEAAWMGQDAFPVHALGPRKYGFAYTPKLKPWLDENLSRFDAVILDGLWLWPSVCATRAVARERARRKAEQNLSHGLTRIDTAESARQPEANKSEWLGADRTGEDASCRVTPALGDLSSETSDLPKSLNVQRSTLNSRHLRCFVMPHGMLDPWFQRDKSRRVKAVRNWFYWWLVERGVVNSADALLFTCQQELELARTTFGGYRPKKEVVVGLGIEEPPAFEPKMQEVFAARCPGLNGRPYLLFMSRVHPKKGVDLLVRAYARLRREHEEKNVSHGLTRIDPAESARQPEANKSERLAADRTEGNADCRMTSTAGGLSEAARPEHDSLPDLVIAGPGWDSTYGQQVRTLIDEANRSIASTAHRTLNTANSACIHAVDMLQGDAKWGALYGCEAFVLPSHQENFGIAVVEALACGKPVLISDQVNIWREIAEDGAGFVDEDTEEGVEKLLRRFLYAQRDETGDLRAEAGSKPRECYLKRFAIGPAAAKLAKVLATD